MEEASETLQASGGSSVQCQWKTPLMLNAAVLSALSTRLSSVRFGWLSHLGMLSETPPAVDNITRKPSLKHILVADTIIPCEYLFMVHTIRLSGFGDFPG